jgi:hypothetical protein
MSKDRSSDKYSRKVREAYNQNTMSKGVKIPSGVYRGLVVNNQDPARKGRIRVQIMKFYGTAGVESGADGSNNTDGSEWVGAMWCRQMLPSGGTTIPEGQAGSVGQSTYGAFGPPPSVGNEVLVAFGGDMHSGIVLGVLPDIDRSDGIAGAGNTRDTTEGRTISLETPRTADSVDATPSPHPQNAALINQGIQDDLVRGQNTSSPARDPSSRVGGMSSPAGHSIVMDDGSLEDGQGLRMRLRTAGGAQILMDDTLGLTYINNREGNVWIELNRNGDIDIYAGGSINYHAENDFNVHCGGNFNVQSGGDINMKSLGAQGIKMEATRGSFNMKCAANMNLQADANGNIRVAGNYRETAGRIDMNGPPAAAASTPTIVQHAGNTNITESVSPRVPEHEPWAGHLDVSTRPPAQGGQTSSDTTYYGDPVDVESFDGQTGELSFNDFKAVTLQTGSLLSFQSGVDRRVDPALIATVEEIARQFGRPLVISSGARDATRNEAVSGASNSQHLRGHAVDISGATLSNNDRLALVRIASTIGIRGIGVYSGGGMHFDNRTGARAGWGNNYSYTSLAAYCAPTVNKHRAGGFS